MTDTAKARYTSLATRRNPFLQRARDCAKFTIPSLMPPEGWTYNTVLPEPYQGLGSRLVVNLASRLMTALLPAGRSFFQLSVTAEALLKAKQDSVDPDLERLLVLTERIITDETERRVWRGPTNVTLEQLIVAGNAMEYLQTDNTIRVYRLDQFVVVRNPAGQMIEFIICDCLSPDSLSGNLKSAYEVDKGPAENASPSGSRHVELYTWGVREGDTWKVHQELNDTPVPNTEGTYQDSQLPFFPLRWASVAGEDYGRSKVEEHLPDLRTLDGLTKAIIDGAGMASRNITMIRPNAAGGLNLRRKLAAANNGSFVIGNPEDVSMLSFTNGQGLQIVQAEIMALRQELSAAFLLGQSAVRNSERTTAYEIRMLTQELEAALGGVYSMLSKDMMARRINRLIVQMQAAQQLPEWPAKTIEPTVLTGIEALGRDAQVQNVVTAAQLIQPLPQDVQQFYVKWPVLLKKAFNGLNLPDAVNTEQEASALRQEQAQTQIAQDTIPKIAGPVAQAAAQGASAS